MTDVERPFDSESFHGHPMVNQIFEPASMETFKSSHERKSKLSKDALHAKLERENRRQEKQMERHKMHQDVKDRLEQEQYQNEHTQRQMHQLRDSLQIRRTHADKAEQDIETLTASLAAAAEQEEKMAVDLAKVQVEVNAFQARMKAAQEEVQRARDMIEEITAARDKAREEARQLREERREVSEQKRLDEARREGMMKGKLEGMYLGWEDGKVEGYKEGRKYGSQDQYEHMRNKQWEPLRREFPNYDHFEERIPSPDSTYDGRIPERLRSLEAPIIIPQVQKKPQPRKSVPPPLSVQFDERDRMFLQPVQSSPESIHQTLPPPVPMPRPPSRHADEFTEMRNVRPISQMTEERPTHTRQRSNIPPPRPIFETDETQWRPPPRPDAIRRDGTFRNIGERFRRKPEEITHAPEDMDFAPIAQSLPYPSVATPLPHRETIQPGRAMPSPGPSLYNYGRRREEENDEAFFREQERRRREIEREDAEYRENHSGGKPTMFRRLTQRVRGGSTSQVPYDPTDPRAYQDVVPTPDADKYHSVEPSPAPSPAPSPGRNFRDLNTPIVPKPYQPPPSPQHGPLSAIPDNYIPHLEGDGGISLPPPHEMHGSAMQSAITLAVGGSRNPSRNPSPAPSPQQRPRSVQDNRDISPSRRILSNIGGSVKHAASAVAHSIPSRSKMNAEFRGRSRSPARSRSPQIVQIPRDRSRSRSRPRSTIFDDPYIHPVQRQPEDIQIGPDLSFGGSSENIDADGAFASRGRMPVRNSMAMSQMTGRSSPISQMSILSMGPSGALGLSRGGEGRELGLATYPNVSATNLSMIEEERGRHSSYNRSPSPDFPHQPMPGFGHEGLSSFSGRPSAGQRQYSDSTIGVRGAGEDLGGGWEQNSRHPPHTPSSIAGPAAPVKTPRPMDPNHPWSKRPTPSKLMMPALLSPQSQASSSKGGFAGIGAGGGYGAHRRAASASVTGLGLGGPPSFASPQASFRYSVAGSVAGSETGKPPIAPKPQPPVRRSKTGAIILDDPPPNENSPYQNPGHVATRSWSGEQRQIGRTMPSRSRGDSNTHLVTVEERSPYIQGPEARGSTGSIQSVHSNRLKFDENNYVDPAFLIEPDIRTAVEQTLAQPPPPADEPPKAVTAKRAKRVSNVLRFGKKK